MQEKTNDKLKNIKVILQSLSFVFLTTLFVQQIIIYYSNKGIKTVFNFESLDTLFLFLLQELIFLIPVVFYFSKNKQSFTKFTNFKGFKFSQAFLNIFTSFLVFFSLMICLSLFSIFTGINIPGFGEQAEHLNLFGNDKFSFYVSFLSLVIIAPLVEEILFRGFFQTLLSKKYSSRISIFLSALIFSSIHLEFEVILPLFILGYILGWLFENNKSLFVPIIFHIINNGLAFGAELLLK